MAPRKHQGLTGGETMLAVKKLIRDNEWANGTALNLFKLLQLSAEKEARLNRSLPRDERAKREVLFQNDVVDEMTEYAKEEYDAVMNGIEPVYQSTVEPKSAKETAENLLRILRGSSHRETAQEEIDFQKAVILKMGKMIEG